MHFTKSRAGIALVIAIPMFVSGCGGLAQRIRVNLEDSVKIAERCERVQEPFQASNESLARRLRTALTFQVEKASDTCVPVMRQSLSVFVETLKARAKASPQSALIAALAGRLDTRYDEIKASTDAIDLLAATIESKISKARADGLCQDRKKCATRVALLLDSAGSEVRLIVNHLQNLRASVDSVVADLAVAVETFRQSRDDLAFATAQAEREFRLMQKLVDTALRIVADGDYDVIVATYINERLLAIFDKTARSMIKAVIRNMRPMERAIDTADNKTYGLISLGREVFQGDLQDEIDEAAVKVKELFLREAKEESGTHWERQVLQAHLSLARASCEKLLGPASELDDSYLSPFLLKAIINSFTDEDLQRLEDLVKPKGEPDADRANKKTCGDTYDPAMTRFVTTYVGLAQQPELAKSARPTVTEIKLNAHSQSVRSLRADRASVSNEKLGIKDPSLPLSADQRKALDDEVGRRMSTTTMHLQKERLEALKVK